MSRDTQPDLGTTMLRAAVATCRDRSLFLRHAAPDAIRRLAGHVASALAVPGVARRSSAGLEMRPGCECCDRDLSPSDGGVWICSFECTWCSDCVERFPGRRCPNCGGTLMPRPPRSPEKLVTSPAGTRRVFDPGCISALESASTQARTART
jgi:hypothetical protein